MSPNIDGIQLMEKPPWVTVLEYVAERQNPDGGYNFCRGVESCAQDTYYALEIFKLLNIPPPNIATTIKWLREFPADNIYSYFNIAKGLILTSENIDIEVAKRALSMRKPNGGFGTTEVYIDAFEFETTYMVTELLRVLDISFDRQTTAEWLLKHLNLDGGFGANGNSNLISTFHAIASLVNLGYPVRQLDKTLQYIRLCEKPTGGFTMIPNVFPPYLQETYAGILALELMDEASNYPESTRDFVFKLQNSNGGFRRSQGLGISTLENTYYAIHSLKLLPALNMKRI
jgi:hypothetical protein